MISFGKTIRLARNRRTARVQPSFTPRPAIHGTSVWPDGRRAFFNYAYLVAGEFEPNADKNLIKLSFSSHKVSLHGYSLETLFMALLDHLPRIITATDQRYVLEENKTEAIVIQMIVEKKTTRLF